MLEEGHYSKCISFCTKHDLTNLKYKAQLAQIDPSDVCQAKVSLSHLVAKVTNDQLRIACVLKACRVHLNHKMP